MYLLCQYNTRQAVKRLGQVLSKLAKGDMSAKLSVRKNDAYGVLNHHINTLVDNLREATRFSKEIGQGNFQADYTPLSEKDEFGNALLGMLKRLQEVAEQDKTRRWTTEGQAHFAQLFRSYSDDLGSLSRTLITELVRYMGINQGGFFILDETDPEEPILELTACYAYSRQKYLQKRVSAKNGLIGQAYLEKQTIHLKKVPAYYTEITSGLGEATPSSVLIVPLKINEQVEGVIELAAFAPFEPYQVEFVEKLAESIAATISSVKTNDRTRRLLKQSQEQAERMRQQEEQMRQKNEQLERSQEEMSRQKVQLETVLKESKAQEASLASLINNITDIVFTIDAEAHLVLYNQAFVEYYTEVGEEEVTQGLNVLALYPENHKVAFQNDFQRALKGESFYVQRKLIHRGNLNIFDIYYRPIYGENQAIHGVAVFSKDVTEYVRKNEEIRRSQQEVSQQAKQLEHTKEAVNRSGVATVEFDMNGYILDANDAFLKIMKYDSIDEILGESHEVFVPVQQRTGKAYKNFWNRLRNGESTSGQYERIDKNGNTVWLAGSYNVVTEINGKAIMVIQVGFDVTETVELIYKTMQQAQQIQMAQNDAKKQMQALSVETAKQRAIVDMLREGVLMFNKQGVVEYCNPAAALLLNLDQTPEGQAIEELLPIVIEASAQGEAPSFFLQNGTSRTPLVSSAPVLLPRAIAANAPSLQLSLRSHDIGADTYFTVFICSTSEKMFS